MVIGVTMGLGLALVLGLTAMVLVVLIPTLEHSFSPRVLLGATAVVGVYSLVLGSAGAGLCGWASRREV